MCRDLYKQALGISATPVAPQRLVIMADGAVACEMADIWSSLGSKVTILSHNERILERFEPFGDQLAAAFAKRGITIHTKVNVVQGPSCYYQEIIIKYCFIMILHIY